MVPWAMWSSETDMTAIEEGMVDDNEDVSITC